MGKYFSNPVKLSFDPDNLENTVDLGEYSESELSALRRVFEDPIARTFWLGIRPRHLTGPELNYGCLMASKEIQKRGIPDSPEELVPYIAISLQDNESHRLELARELFPYIRGEKELRYEVVVIMK